MPKNDDLSGKIILVTGASKGIGAALSGELIQRNAVVIGIARSTEKLLELHHLLGKKFIPSLAMYLIKNPLQFYLKI